MSTRTRVSLYLDLACGVLGIAAGLLLLLNGTVGLPSVGDVAVPVVAMGLLGAGFSAVGVGHIYYERAVRGGAEFTAGVGAMLVGLSFGVSPQLPAFLIGVVALLTGGLVLLADGFGIGLPAR